MWRGSEKCEEGVKGAGGSNVQRFENKINFKQDGWIVS